MQVVLDLVTSSKINCSEIIHKMFAFSKSPIDELKSENVPAKCEEYWPLIGPLPTPSILDEFPSNFARC